MQEPPVPPQTSGVPAPAGEPSRTVPWTGRDLTTALLTGGGLGLVLAVFAALVLAPSDVRLSSAAELLVLSIAIYGPLCFFGWRFTIKRHGASLEDAGFRWVGFGPLLLMIPASIALMIVTGILSYATSLFLGDVPTAQEQVLPNQDTLSVIDLVMLVIAGAIVAPVAEEFLFRGLFFQYLRGRRALWVAIVVSSLVFAVAHFVPILIPVLIVFGIAEALVMERYGSIWPAIALHALNNGALFLALFAALN